MPKTESNRKYRIVNWAEYNRSLIQRGSLTIWVEDGTLENWYALREQGKGGRPHTYSDEAILMALTIRSVYGLPLRALQGFLQSLFLLLGICLKVPSYTQICRRAKSLDKTLKQLSKRQPTDLVFDSTGLKVYGEGEWKVRIHGTSKRRTWRKLHIGIDPDSGEIILAELTSNSAGDAQVAESLIDDAPKRVERVYGDGAYDSLNFRKKIYDIGALPKIPPPRNATTSRKISPAVQDRNCAISVIKGLGDDDLARSIWKKLIGYHQRSLVETTMYRYKQIFGEKLRSRCMANQQTESRLNCLILNRMTRIGMPKGYWEDLGAAA